MSQTVTSPSPERKSLPLKLSAIVYSPPKRGKTVGLLSAFPCALFLGMGTGLHSASWLGLDITKRMKLIETIEDAIRFVEKYHKKFPAIVIDDASILFDRTYKKIRSEYKGNNRFAIPDTFNDRVYELVGAIEAADCDVALSMHEQGPKKTEKGVIPGCPMIPGWSWPEKLPGLVDFIARVVHDPTFKGWPYVYQTGADAEFVQGDRLSITPARFPQNLGEILRAAGREVPRPREFAWMENVVEAIALQYLEQHEAEDFDFAGFLRMKARRLGTKVPDARHVRWALKDALDRAQLRKAQANLIDDFIDSVATSKLSTEI